MSSDARLTGLVPATLTPFDAQGGLACELVAPLVDRLIADGVAGLYVCGSTGEGVSLTTGERRQVAEAYVAAAAGRVPVILQVGHNSLADAADLAAHAEGLGVAAISATCPSYFKAATLELLIDCAAQVAAAAPRTPFYYYHIPVLTGLRFDMVEFLSRAQERIPNLAGMKFTDPALHEFQRCLSLDGGRYQLFWGADEMLLGAWATGARAAVGSTYNLAAPLFLEVTRAVEAGDLGGAARAQLRAVELITLLQKYTYLPALKELLRREGRPCGGCRLPIARLSPAQIDGLHRDYDLWREAG